MYKERDAEAIKLEEFWYDYVISIGSLYGRFMALTNFLNDSNLVQEDEVEPLKSLESFAVERSADAQTNFKLVFRFKENDFFTDAELVKE